MRFKNPWSYATTHAPQTARWENFCQNQTVDNSASLTSKQMMNLPLEKEIKISAASL